LLTCTDAHRASLHHCYKLIGLTNTTC